MIRGVRSGKPLFLGFLGGMQSIFHLVAGMVPAAARLVVGVFGLLYMYIPIELAFVSS